VRKKQEVEENDANWMSQFICLSLYDSPNIIRLTISKGDGGSSGECGAHGK